MHSKFDETSYLVVSVVVNVVAVVVVVVVVVVVNGDVAVVIT